MSPVAQGTSLSSLPRDAELFGSTFRETGDLAFIKRLIGELKQSPLTTRAAKLILSKVPSPGRESRKYGQKAVENFLYVSENVHLITLDKNVWKPSPYGVCWILLAPGYEELMSLRDKVFLLRHLLMIDSHNHGLWLTSILDSIAQEHGQTPVTTKRIVQCFIDNLGRHTTVRIKTATASHKVQQMLAWTATIGLVRNGPDGFFLSEEGNVAASLHERLLAEGYDAYRRKAGPIIAKVAILMEPALRRKGPLSEKMFEKSIKNTVSLIRGKLGSGRPVSIPSLRTVGCVQLLARGYEISDEEFDNRLIALTNKLFYKYSLQRSREPRQYPFPGVKAPRGSFYYFDAIES